jgi:hypothetical protein
MLTDLLFWPLATILPVGIFWLTFSGIQGFWIRSWSATTRFLWFAICLGGILCAGLAWVATFWLLSLLGLDVLQRMGHGAIVLITATVVALLMLALIQWLFLRNAATKPFMRSIVNTLIAGASLPLLYLNALGQDAWGGGINLFLSLLIGSLVGAIVGRIFG